MKAPPWHNVPAAVELVASPVQEFLAEAAKSCYILGKPFLNNSKLEHDKEHADQDQSQTRKIEQFVHSTPHLLGLQNCYCQRKPDTSGYLFIISYYILFVKHFSATFSAIKSLIKNVRNRGKTL